MLISFFGFYPQSLSSLGELPLDVLYPICSFLPDEDLYHLLFTSKNINSVVLNHIRLNLDVNRYVFGCISSGHTASVRNLLKFQKVALIKDLWLLLACYKDHLDLVKVLCRDPTIDPMGVGRDISITDACKRGQDNVVRILLENTAVDPSMDNNKLIMISSSNNFSKMVGLLLRDSRVNPSDQQNRALISASASANGHTDVVKLLLEDPRVNPSDQQNRALISASANGHTDVVRLLLLTSERSEELEGRLGVNPLDQGQSGRCANSCSFPKSRSNSLNLHRPLHPNVYDESLHLSMDREYSDSDMDHKSLHLSVTHGYPSITHEHPNMDHKSLHPNMDHKSLHPNMTRGYPSMTREYPEPNMYHKDLHLSVTHEHLHPNMYCKPPRRSTLQSDISTTDTLDVYNRILRCASAKGYMG